LEYMSYDEWLSGRVDTELFRTGDMSGVHYITYFVYPIRTVPLPQQKVRCVVDYMIRSNASLTAGIQPTQSLQIISPHKRVGER